MDFVKLGLVLALVCAAIYLVVRWYIGRKKYGIDDIIRSFVTGFALSLCSKLCYVGYEQSCVEFDDSTHTCLILGALALGVFALDGFVKAIKRRDPLEKTESPK